MESTPDTANTIDTSPRLNVGAALRAAREAQGLTVADVAERVKFSARQVEALEADDTSRLPQGTFLRGFIRSYARVLHLDESALLGSLAVQAEQHPVVAETHAKAEALPTSGSARRYSVYLLAGAFAIALVLAFFVWSHHESPKLERTVLEEVKLPDVVVASAPVPASPGEVVQSAVQAPGVMAKIMEPVVAPVARDKPKAVEPAKVPVPIIVPQVSLKPVVAAKVIEPVKASVPLEKPKAAEPATGAAPVSVPLMSGKPEVPLEQLKKRPIHVVFLDEAWLQITDTNGEVLLSRMNPAGSEKWIGGGRRAPYQVSIGKAKSVRLFYKGREVDLSHYNQTGLVQLELE